MGNKQESSTFPGDPDLLCTGTIIKDNKEKEMDDLLFYDSIMVLHDPKVFVDKISNTAHLDDLATFRPTEHKYWEDFLSDDANQPLINQGIIDYCEQYNINANDIATVMTPLKPRYNMKLSPASYLHKMFKSPNCSANLKRQDEANATDMIYSVTPAINGGEKCAHLFIGKNSKLTDAYKVKQQSSE